MQRMRNGLSIIGLTLSAVAIVYAWYLNYTAMPPMFAGMPATNLIVFAAMAMLIAIIYAGYHNASVPDFPIRKTEPHLAPVDPAPPPRRHPGLSILLVPVLVFAGFYLRHILHGSDHAMWIDTYWLIILPAMLTVVIVGWLWDTVFGRLINGTHSGRSRLSLRTALIVKRIAVACLIMGLALLLTTYSVSSVQEIYRNPLAQLLISAIFALGLSPYLIAR